MKYTKCKLAAACLAGVCLIQPSCKSPERPEASVKTYSETSGEKFKEDDFSQWMSKADQQVAYDQLEKGTYIAYTEGRSNGGLQQFRHVVKPQPEEKDAKWATFWGLSASEFYQVDLKLQRDGYDRRSLQVFTDGTGASFHQAVWFKKGK